MSLSGTVEPNGALYVPVTLFSAGDGRRWMGRALVDTGAQFALVHPIVIGELALTALGERDLDSAIGPALARAFLVHGVVTDIFDGKLSALETRSRERVVLGRHFLEKMRLVADWPRRTFTLDRVA